MLWACAAVALFSVIGSNLLRDRAGAGHAASDGATATTAAMRSDDEPLRLTSEAPAFSLVDQNNKPVTLDALKGKPFVANFIFTNCAGPCPTMTAKMARLQDALPAEIKLVSFSVDPARDRPDVLKKYAGSFNADDQRWHFLTVADPNDADGMYTLSRAMLLAATPAQDDRPIIHSEKFVLVDVNGTIRSYYSSGSPKQMEQLVTDAKDLLEARESSTK
jgi:protein SCO1/2